MPKMPQTKQSRLSTSGKLKNQRRMPEPRQGKAFQLDLEHYYLRSLRKPDANSDFTEWMNDAELLAGMNLPAFNMTVQDLQNYIGGANNLDKYLIGIFTKPDMKLIGFFQVDVSLLHRRASLTAAIGEKDWWGKGVLKETARPLVDMFFEHRNIDKMSLRITSKNRKILFSLMGTRFKHEGCLKQEVLAPGGERLDVHVFGRTKIP
ncbi:MAG: GNAT family protein [Pseudomonadota bacterium]